MKQKLKALLFSLSLVMGIATPLVMAPSIAQAVTPHDAACSGANLDIEGGSNTDGCDPSVKCDPASANPANECKVNGLLATVINILSLVVGVIAVIMIIVGGLKYIMSSGDSNNINSAKNTILYAIIGLVVVALAQVIVKFVLAKTPQ